MVCRGKCVILFMALLLPWGCGSNDEEKPLDLGPTVDARMPINFTFNHLVEACIRLSACEVDRKPDLQQCLDNFHKRLMALGQRELYERAYHCVNQGHGDCKIIRECLGYAGRPKKCDSSYTPRCDGDVAYNCDLRVTGGWEQALDCNIGRLKCGVKKTGTTTAAICGGGTCDKSKYKSKCVNKKLHKCVGGAVEINDCVEQQLQCRDPAVDQCEGTGRSCGTISDTCTGNKVTECIAGYLSEIDCTKLPGNKICDKTTIECKGRGTECGMSQTFFDTCEGSSLVVCVDRYKKKYDCKKLGFEGCEKATTYGAYCKAKFVYD